MSESIVYYKQTCNLISTNYNYYHLFRFILENGPISKSKILGSFKEIRVSHCMIIDILDYFISREIVKIEKKKVKVNTQYENLGKKQMLCYINPNIMEVWASGNF